MEPTNLLLNIDHIIGIKLFKESICNAYVWIPPIIKEKKYWFKPNETISCGGKFIDVYNKEYEISDITKFIEKYYKNTHIVRNIDKPVLDQRLQVFNKSYVKITFAGGKHTLEEEIYFDDYKDACEFINSIEIKYPNRFIINKHDE